MRHDRSEKGAHHDMKRRLLTFGSVMSLLLCLATVAMWVRSYAQLHGTAETLVVGRVNRASKTFYSAWMKSYSGRLEIDAYRVTVTDDYLYRLHLGFEPHGVDHRVNIPLTIDGPVSEPTSVWSAFEVAYEKSDDPKMSESEVRFRLKFPYWAAAVASGLLPGLWAWRRSRTRRTRALGHCTACGYDLRASPDRCPECGAPAAPHAR